jgi:hypothetical protein
MAHKPKGTSSKSLPPWKPQILLLYSISVTFNTSPPPPPPPPPPSSSSSSHLWLRSEHFLQIVIHTFLRSCVLTETQVFLDLCDSCAPKKSRRASNSIKSKKKIPSPVAFFLRQSWSTYFCPPLSVRSVSKKLALKGALLIEIGLN